MRPAKKSASVPSLRTPANAPKIPESKVDTFTRLQAALDMFMHAEHEVERSERSMLPLPLSVPAESELRWNREPLLIHRDDGPSRASESQLARIDGTMTLLSERILVLFGGQNARGPCLPFACDSLLRHWWPIASTFNGKAAEAPITGIRPRCGHAAVAFGQNRSLLLVVGGQDPLSGTLLDDTCVLEMRGLESAAEGEARREIRAECIRISETLALLRSRQSLLRSILLGV